jgi:hypothetical protein
MKPSSRSSLRTQRRCYRGYAGTGEGAADLRDEGLARADRSPSGELVLNGKPPCAYSTEMISLLNLRKVLLIA